MSVCVAFIHHSIFPVHLPKAFLHTIYICIYVLTHLPMISWQCHRVVYTNVCVCVCVAESVEKCSIPTSFADKDFALTDTHIRTPTLAHIRRMHASKQRQCFTLGAWFGFHN